jgi:hypothetical protein
MSEGQAVALENRQRIRAILKAYGVEGAVQKSTEDGQPSQIAGLTTYKLMALQNWMAQQIEAGANTIQAEEAAREAAVKDAANQIVIDQMAGKTVKWDGSPVRPGSMTEAQTMPQGLRKRMMRMADQVRKIGRGIAPVEVVADWMSGNANYDGLLARLFLQPLDLARKVERYSADKAKSTFRALADKHKLGDHDMVAIAIHLGVRQGESVEAGVRAHMKERFKYDDERIEAEIEKFRNVADLTEGQRAYVEAVDAYLGSEEHKQSLQAAHRAYDNTEIKFRDGYFPAQRTMENEPDLPESIRIDLEGAMAQTSGTTPRGQKTPTHHYVDERVEFSDRPLKFLNAYDSLMDYIDRSEAFKATAGHLRQMRDIVVLPEFKAAYGDMGQRYWSDWIDLLAKHGKAGQSVRWIDTMVRNVAVGRLLWRAITAIRQLGAIVPAIGRTGFVPIATAAKELATNPAARKFLEEHADQVKFRGYREPVRQWAHEGGISATGFREKAAEIGALPMEFLDRLSASASWLGAYFKALDKAGIAWQSGGAIPYNEKAWLRANTEMRRSQSSTFYEHMPMATTRGWLTGNRSLERAFFQFQNYMLAQYQTIRHDVFREVGKNANYQQASRFAFFTALAFAIEAALVTGWYHLLPLGQGDDEEFGEKYAQNLLQQSAGNIPFVSNLTGPLFYNSPFVAVEGSVFDIIEGGIRVVRGDEWQTKARGALRAARGAGSLAGIPGAGEATDWMRRAIPPTDEQAQRKGLMAAAKAGQSPREFSRDNAETFRRETETLDKAQSRLRTAAERYGRQNSDDKDVAEMAKLSKNEDKLELLLKNARRMDEEAFQQYLVKLTRAKAISDELRVQAWRRYRQAPVKREGGWFDAARK